MDNIAKQVGKRVRELRKFRGLSQEELGEKGGFHYSYIGQVEQGEKNVSLSNLEKIADTWKLAFLSYLYFPTTESLTEDEQEIKDIIELLHGED